MPSLCPLTTLPSSTRQSSALTYSPSVLHPHHLIFHHRALTTCLPRASFSECSPSIHPMIDGCSFVRPGQPMIGLEMVRVSVMVATGPAGHWSGLSWASRGKAGRGGCSSRWTVSVFSRLRNFWRTANGSPTARRIRGWRTVYVTASRRERPRSHRDFLFLNCGSAFPIT